jgi:hypothetical protein
MVISKSYYNLGSAFLAGVSILFTYLTFSPFLGFDSPDAPILNEQISLEDELRMHRNMYIAVANSNNPVFSEDVKNDCKTGVSEIETSLYEKKYLTPEEEFALRKRLHEINNKLAVKIENIQLIQAESP